MDFVVEERPRLLAVELKAANMVPNSDARHLRAFLQNHPASVRGFAVDEPLSNTASDALGARSSLSDESL